MTKRLPFALAVAVAASAILGVGTASAATEFGSGCAANNFKDRAIWVSTNHAASSPLPVTAPISGVITEWRVNSSQEAKSEEGLAGELARIFQQRLLVLKSNGRETPAGPLSFTVVAETSGGLVNLMGTNTYPARLPVQAGDYLGLAGNPYALFCETGDETDRLAATVGGTPVGSTFKAQEGTRLQVPVTARIEPDVDGDGYGDETQDQCPQSAAYQSPCPTVTVSSLSLTGTKAVVVYVTTSQVAPVAVGATVKIGKGKKVKLSAAAKTVTPGTLARYRLAFTKPVRKTLAALSTKKALRLKIAASATNVAGAISTASSTLKLRGRKSHAPRVLPFHGKPSHHHRHGKKPAKK